MRDLRSFLETLSKRGELAEVSRRTDPRRMAALVTQPDAGMQIEESRS